MNESKFKSSQRVIYLRLLLEEIRPEIVHLIGPKNVVADAPKQGDTADDVEAMPPFSTKDEEIFVIKLQLIQNSQSKDTRLTKMLMDNTTSYKRMKIENAQVIIY